MGEDLKPVIIISAVNFRNGGPLSVLLDVLRHAQNNLLDKYNVIALVHCKALFNDKGMKGIHFLEFPDSIHSYFKRLYLEYYFFKKVSLRYKPYLWLSLHDITPNVRADVRAVYCHNPSPFYKLSWAEFLLDKKFYLFSLFYKLLYAINIKKNNYVIVQQDWLRNEFMAFYKLNENSIIVANPGVEKADLISNNKIKSSTNEFTFFYPSFPRVFKNFEVILQAVEMLNSKNTNIPFKIVLTIDGSENSYTQQLIYKYSCVKNIQFVGLLEREAVYRQYRESDCLLFPSKLETWGLPLTEAKEFNLPIIASDLPYAHETVGNYNRVLFFDSLSPYALADAMIMAMNNKFSCVTDFVSPAQPFAKDWQQLFKILLKGK